MKVALWDQSNPNISISGLQRYSEELYKYCKNNGVDVSRYGSTRSPMHTFLGYKPSDITHLTNQQIAFVGKLKRVKNCVVTVHDVIPHYWYDIRRSIKEKWIFNEFCLGSLDSYIVDSEYTKQDISTLFKIPDEKITVVPLGVDHSIFNPKDRTTCREMFGMDQDETYILSVSSGYPWKNTQILEKISYNIIDIGYGRGEFGYISDERLACLYSACDAFLAPSIAEGFGLPVVEAMACGCPVIASNATSYPEVVGDGGILVNPHDPYEWNTAIEKVLSSRCKWSRMGVERASTFSWETCGKETVSVYEGMMQ